MQHSTILFHSNEEGTIYVSGFNESPLCVFPDNFGMTDIERKIAPRKPHGGLFDFHFVLECAGALPRPTPLLAGTVCMAPILNNITGVLISSPPVLSSFMTSLLLWDFRQIRDIRISNPPTSRGDANIIYSTYVDNVSIGVKEAETP